MSQDSGLISFFRKAAAYGAEKLVLHYSFSVERKRAANAKVDAKYKVG